MGKKKRQNRRERDANMFVEEDYSHDVAAESRKGAKASAKMRKKMRKKQLRDMKIKDQKNRHRGRESKDEYKGWHSITIEGQNALEKNFILTSIGSDVEVEFRPLGFYKMGNSSGFYLEKNEPAAIAIGALDKRLQGPDGSRLRIDVKKCETPDLVLNSNQLQVLREVLSQRFQFEACLLDLSDFHHDQKFLDQEILAPLACSSIMKQVVRVIRENVPHLKALNLSKNNLKQTNLRGLQGLEIANSQLAALNLEHNEIQNLSVLKQIKMFPLLELNLKFNPLLETFKNRPLDYIRLVKKEMNTLKIIDNVDIDAFIAEKECTKEVGQKGEPSSENVCSTTTGAVSEGMVRTFLEQYYALVDTPERTTLIAAYTPDAVMEVKSAIAGLNSSVLVGHANISKGLADFPGTQHNHSSFSFNIQPLNPNVTQAIVTGQVQLVGTGIVAFARKMNIVSFNSGFCCSQDLLELRGL